MGTTNQFNYSSSASTTLTTTTETAVLTMNGLNTRGPSDTIMFEGQGKVASGTGVTAVTATLRRGSGITGTIVAVAEPQPLAASTTGTFTWSFVDAPGEIANASYTVTLTQVGATGNGTVSYVAGAASLP